MAGGSLPKPIAFLSDESKAPPAANLRDSPPFPMPHVLPAASSVISVQSTRAPAAEMQPERGSSAAHHGNGHQGYKIIESFELQGTSECCMVPLPALSRDTSVLRAPSSLTMGICRDGAPLWAPCGPCCPYHKQPFPHTA